MASHPAVAALNHLLSQNAWARQRLMRFAGKTARLELAPFAVTCTVVEDGTLRAGARDASADATCTAPAAVAARLALRDDSALELVECAGDGALSDEILFLVRNLQWDAAEDLSRLTGDIAAERIVQFARGAKRQAGQAAGNLAHALAEYWTEERPLVSKAERIAAFAQGVTRLRESLEALDKRIQQVSKAR